MIMMGFYLSSISYSVVSIFVFVSPCFYVKMCSLSAAKVETGLLIQKRLDSFSVFFHKCQHPATCVYICVLSLYDALCVYARECVRQY